MDVTVSMERLKSALEDWEISSPDTIEYDRTVIVDNDTTVEDRDGIPYLAGRVKQRTEAETSGADTALTSVDASIAPPRLNARSNGRFVTALLEVPSGSEASDLQLETLVAEDVQAVTDEQYGFVRNIPSETRQGTEYAMVKFPRDELIDSLGVGNHNVAMTAVFGQTSVTALTTLEVFEPGGGSKGNNGNGSNHPGTGNGPPGNGSPSSGPPHNER